MTYARRACGAHVYWWDGEYDDNCIRARDHEGHHWDGLSWFDDSNEMQDSEHEPSERPDDVVR